MQEEEEEEAAGFRNLCGLLQKAGGCYSVHVTTFCCVMLTTPPTASCVEKEDIKRPKHGLGFSWKIAFNQTLGKVKGYIHTLDTW